MPILAPSRRTRRTPFSQGVEAAGVRAYTVYNRMLLPTVFNTVEEDYHHLKQAVQVWDVACERQVELRGPDARRLLQILTPRDLERLTGERALYVPICNQFGGMMNDPVAIMVDEDRYWLSIADGDLRLWVAALAAANRFDVEISEPDVSPLAVQGPKADALMEAVFGAGPTELRFFGCGRISLHGVPFVVTRTGYSKQGGFEIYVEGHENGMDVWNALMEAGRDLDVRAGCPNLIERVEGGLLSFGNDMTEEDTPLNCNFDAYVSDSQLDTCFGGRALKEERARGPARRIRPIELRGLLPSCDRVWPLWHGDERVGQVTSAAWSPDFNCGVAIGMVRRDHWEPGTELMCETQDGPREAVVGEKFWA